MKEGGACERPMSVEMGDSSCRTSSHTSSQCIVPTPAPPPDASPPLAPQVQVLRWQPSVELLAGLGDEDEEERYACGVRNFDFDAGLAPYNFAAYGAWLELAGGISPETLERLLPVPLPPFFLIPPPVIPLLLPCSALLRAL